MKRGGRNDEAVAALSQMRSGMELAQLAAAMGAPLTSAQRAASSLVSDGFARVHDGPRPRIALVPDHPAAPERLQLALRILPLPRAMDIVLRASPAVEFAGDDDSGHVVVLSPFAAPDDIVRLRSTVVRIQAGRDEARPVTIMERNEVRESAQDDPSLRERGLRLRVITGSAQRTFPNPDRHHPADAALLGRLHPSLGRIPRAELQALADR